MSSKGKICFHALSNRAGGDYNNEHLWPNYSLFIWNRKNFPLVKYANDTGVFTFPLLDAMACNYLDLF